MSETVFKPFRYKLSRHWYVNGNDVNISNVLNTHLHSYALCIECHMHNRMYLPTFYKRHHLDMDLGGKSNFLGKKTNVTNSKC